MIGFLAPESRRSKTTKAWKNRGSKQLPPLLNEKMNHTCIAFTFFFFFGWDHINIKPMHRRLKDSKGRGVTAHRLIDRHDGFDMGSKKGYPFPYI